MTEALGIWKLVDHPLRREIWRRMLVNDEAVSPTDIALDLDAPLGNVSYHVGRLAERKAIVRVRREPRRGAFKSFYAATGKFDRQRVLERIEELDGAGGRPEPG